MQKFLFSLLLYCIALTTSGCSSLMYIWSGVVFPEQYGAVGDGVADDTDALRKAFEANKTIVLKNKYKVSESLILHSSLVGGGQVLFSKEQISLHVSGYNYKIKSISFDYMNHSGKMIRVQNSSNITFTDCRFENVGNKQATSDVAFVMITNKSNYIKFNKCGFLHCTGCPQNTPASGIWINQDSENQVSHHIYIDDCSFDDISPSSDADGIKVVGGNYDCYLYVSNCSFRNCDKRAMKFQGRQCYSSHNTIYVHRPMSYAIDFQRGFGGSSGDKIVLDYDGVSTIDGTMGLLYRAVGIAQGNVRIEGMEIQNIRAIDNLHQVAFGFESLGGYDNSNIVNTDIKNCKIFGMGSIMSSTQNVSCINNLNMTDLYFESITHCDAILLRQTKLLSSYIEIDIKGTALYNILYSQPELIKDNTFKIKTESSRKLFLLESNKIEITSK